MGNVTMMDMPYHFSALDIPPQRACPVLGQHNEEVLKDWLRLDDVQLEELKKRHAITQ